jgi:signal transduction histidine kinase
MSQHLYGIALIDGGQHPQPACAVYDALICNCRFSGKQLSVTTVILTVLLSLVWGQAIAAHQSPNRVLILHSFGPNFGDLYSQELRAELDAQLPGDVELYEEWLVSARFTTPQEDDLFVDHLRFLFANHPLDLVITLGAPAANFVQQHREELFPSTPKLLADVEARRVSPAGLAADETTVAVAVDFSTLVRGILQVLPKTTNLVVLIGNSPIERYWVGQIRDSLEPFRERLTLNFLNELPFDEVLRRVATLPPRSAILYVLLSPALQGIPGDEGLALAKLHAAANSPIFSYSDAYLGKGIVGGPLLSGRQQSNAIVRVALRILKGTPARDIKTPPIPFGNPQFDVRELRRWHIKDSDLPPNSVVRFTKPSAWDTYRLQILSVVTLMLVQSALIVALLYQRRRRRDAENLARRQIADLAHMNRVSTIGELSASIVHELGQPLTAILTNSEVAELILSSSSPKVAELKEIVHDIRRDDLRACEVISRLRRLLHKAPIEMRAIELNEMVEEVVEFLSSQTSAYGILLSAQFAQPALRLRADRIQLQQVVLNLIMNAMDAVKSTQGSQRTILVRTSLLNRALAEVSIEDSGPGIAPGKEKEIFEAFYTTKEAGMGMGLSISRTIIENHGGEIRAENRSTGGASFRFTLPLNTGSQPIIDVARQPEHQPDF